MSFNQHSSGDVIVDRRADYARMFATSGDYAAAAELIEQALELAPAWTAGFFKLGDYCEKAGQTQKAVEAYKTVLRLDEAGIFGAYLKLAVLGVVEPPEQMPSSYVAGLFDDYAERFETSLVTKLDYMVPQELARLIRRNIKDRDKFICSVDLGCGTGLFGQVFHTLTEELQGFDISANMLAKAEEKGIYHHLGQSDLTLSPSKSGLFHENLSYNRADLIIAADVLMYLGALDNILNLVKSLITEQGYFAFSIEESFEMQGYQLQNSLRYAHSLAYVEDLLSRNAFQLVSLERMTIRTDGGKPIQGILFIARN